VTELVKKRVLIVDDAVVIRKILSDALAADPNVEVAGTAANGRIALTKFGSLRPDIVLLDIEMPEMDGLETVRQLRQIDSRVPIIMFSTPTEHGASATLEALALGATDYVSKPSNFDSDATSEAIKRELIPKIRALCRVPEPLIAVSRTGNIAVPLTSRPRVMIPARLVAIGVSTGGPDALARLLPTLPTNLAVPLVIAQHMPPLFTKMLAARLSGKSALPVRECISGEELMPGTVYLAPGDFHMIVTHELGVPRLRTTSDPKENFCRPSVDVLFRSVAQVYGPKCLGIVLTGMGQDGLRGCEQLYKLGARIIAQDEATSVVWGMPGLVAKAGLADKILPLERIGGEIIRATSPSLAAGSQG
jgi:two-component system, chemotaxis family, protein-glutamate methylesterase/glutaminase